MIHFHLCDLKNAQTYAQKSVELAQQTNEKSIEGESLNWLGRILGKADPSQSDKAKEYIFSGIKLSESLKTKVYYSMGYFFLGGLYADSGQKDLALENLKKAEVMFQEMELDYWLGKTREVLGRL